MEQNRVDQPRGNSIFGNSAIDTRTAGEFSCGMMEISASLIARIDFSSHASIHIHRFVNLRPTTTNHRSILITRYHGGIITSVAYTINFPVARNTEFWMDLSRAHGSILRHRAAALNTNMLSKKHFTSGDTFTDESMPTLKIHREPQCVFESTSRRSFGRT